MEIQAIAEFPLRSGVSSVANSVGEFAGLQSGQFIQAVCGVTPTDSMIRRVTLENPAKARDPAYLPAYLSDQFKIKVSDNRVAVLNANGGAGFDPERQLTKEIVFCGAPRERIVEVQKQLTELSVYPVRLELSTVAVCGGVMSYMKAVEESMPTLVLELGVSGATVLICNGDELDIARPIPYGLDSMYPVVQKELGLKDEASARKLFTSSTFDFTEMGGMLLKKLMKELQASTGFYEVQTGMTIGHIMVSSLPKNLQWIASTLSRTLGVEILNPDYKRWFEAVGISLGSDVDLANLDSRFMSLFSLMARYSGGKVS